jgi:hypothetical protein
VRSAPCTWRRGAWVSWLSLKTKVVGFPSLGLKTGSCGLVIWASKSPRQFLGLGPKTKRATICRLRKKIDGRRTAWVPHRDLAACFTMKQVGLGFPSLLANWQRSDGGWCTWHYHRGHVKMKPKTDVSMRWAASGSSTPTLPFL